MLDLGLDVLFKGKNMARLLGGLGVALKISAVSVIISLPLGILLGVLMTSRNPVIKAVLRLYLEFVRIMPQMVLLFLVYFGTTRAFGWNLSGETASIIVFVLWGTAEMSDLVRGALIAIPKHQYESAEALGMNRWQTMRYIILPQAMSTSMPAFMANVIFLLKETSVFSAISLMDLMFTAKDLIGLYYKTPECLFLLVVFYLIILLPVSIVGSLIERRLRYAGFGS